jgi:HPt (histidine-containing phosphotransfer) domain-containing protein
MCPTSVSPAWIYSSLGGDADLAGLVAIFVDELPCRTAMLSGALESGDFEGLRRAAHQLKGAAGSYGFDTITSSAARVEQAVRQDAPEAEIQAALNALVDLCRRTRPGTPD